MNIEWLRARVPGFGQLPQVDYEEITSFFWLWSFFEANNLNCHASVPAIQQLAQGWNDSGQLVPDRFEESLAYFKNRYFQNAVATHHYAHLNLQFHGIVTEQLVKAVLTEQNTSNRDAIAVLLIIVYRLRNNLVHGPKWLYELQGQLNNFRHANSILRNAMEMDGQGLNLA